jgi:hypothetical protein
MKKMTLSGYPQIENFAGQQFERAGGEASASNQVTKSSI